MAYEDKETTYAALRKNRWRTLWLFMLFPAMLATITYLSLLSFSAMEYGSVTPAVYNSAALFFDIAPFVTVGAVLWVIIALLWGRRMVLAFAGAKPIEKRDNPALYRSVENLAIRTGIPTPKIYIIDDHSLNAFATGYSPKNSAVAITKGLLEKLDKSELEAVMAHEFGHILHRDTRVMLMAITMVGIIQVLAEVILRMIFHRVHYGDDEDAGRIIIFLLAAAVVIWLISAFGAVFVQLGISRRREYSADIASAHITRHPTALVSALQKISKDARVEVLDGKRSIAALCIADPLEKKKDFLDKLSGLFATHPPLKKRITALNGLAGTLG